MTMTAQQLSDFQKDIGISADQSVFTDDEIRRLYDRAGQQYNKAIVLALRQLIANAVKMSDYAAGQTQEKRSQVFENLLQMLEYYENEVVRTERQMLIVGVTSVPPIYKDLPSDEEHPDEKNRRHNDRLPQNRRRRWRGGF